MISVRQRAGSSFDLAIVVLSPHHDFKGEPRGSVVVAMLYAQRAPRTCYRPHRLGDGEGREATDHRVGAQVLEGAEGESHAAALCVPIGLRPVDPIVSRTGGVVKRAPLGGPVRRFSQPFHWSRS